jgi:adenine-specific DNA methylase
MTEPKKLIEVAMPVKEVSAESVRDKSIRHGHISTLHLWWARRPLPVCRAVVFASLVPDPLDENCPAPFKQAVAKFLADKIYKPYDDIPHTAAIDPMEDNLRNRLLMFIGKFSDEYVANEKTGKTTDSKKQLSDGSLIKWENKNNPKIIGIARKLIFIAHNTSEAQISSPNLGEVSASRRTEGSVSLIELETLYDHFWNAILIAETALYSTPNRHLETPEIQVKEKVLHEAIENYLDLMPRVFDPFAGGGAIPLEAARLGCRTFGNDLNPVAHIIQRGSVEFPQKYGKPITYAREEFLKQYPVFAESHNKNTVAEPNYNYSLHDSIEIDGYEDAISKKTEIQNREFIKVKNRLAFDVEYYARHMLAGAEKEIGQYYPEVNGKKPIAYYWTHVGTCSNPSCRAEVPLLKQFYLVNKPGKKIYLNPIIDGNKIDFEIETGEYILDGWNNRGNLKCPCCGNTTDVKQIKEQSKSGVLKQRIIAVIEDGENGKNYRLPTKHEIQVSKEIPEDIEMFRPIEQMQRNSAGGDTFSWGYSVWGQMLSPRQLLAMQTFVNQLNLFKNQWRNNNFELDDYQKAVVTYLGIFIDRLAPILTTFGRWDTSRENLQHPFSRQAIPMIFDYPEGNPFGDVTGSATNQLVWLTRYISDENNLISATCNHTSSGEKSQFDKKYLNAVITDPPYYDAIAYADLSDFFYVWLKRTLGDVFPFNFATPQTPKTEECTALKHHHKNNYETAKQHFENKLQQIFTAIEQQTSGVVSIMFAHQSTEAWTTLVNSILGANMNINGSWPFDSEMGNRMIAMDKLALASSVTVACRPNAQTGYISFKAVRKNIEERVKKEVKLLYGYGFRGADLLTACFGQAVSEFGQYQTVEKADGTKVEVKELLELAREAAFNAIISDIDTDEVTKFYIGWLNLYGFVEADHDDVTGITKVGLSIEVSMLQQHHVFERNGNKESLSGYVARCTANQKLGTQANSFAIDKVHKAMLLFGSGNRVALTEYLGQVAPSPDASFWRICTALAEVLPNGCDDHKQLTGLLTNKESLIREAQRRKQETPEQGTLGL